MPDHAWVQHENGWCHRPWWKVAINTVLRILQPRIARKWVIYTVTLSDDDGQLLLYDGRPRATGYGFGRILHRRPS